MKNERELSRIKNLIRRSSLSRMNGGDFRKVLSALKSKTFVDFDCPDGYHIGNNCECIIFEHFEIDAARKSKKGSALKSKHAEASRAFANEIKDVGDVCEFDSTLKDGENIEFLFESFKTNYLNHYEKIELYKKNILQRNPHITDFRVCFVIEQLFSFGLVGYREDEPHRFSYLHFPVITEVNNVFKKYPVDYMLNIVHMPLTGGAIGLREIELSDGRQAFTMDDPLNYFPEISFQTIQDTIDYNYSMSIEEFRKDRNFMLGRQYYHVVAHKKK